MPTQGDWKPPQWLTEALATTARAPLALVNPHADIAVGDLRVAQVDDERRLVLIDAINLSPPYAVVFLATNETDQATDSDLVLPPPSTRLTYAVAIQSTIRGAVWLSQLGKLIGRISERDQLAVRSLLDVGDGSQESVSLAPSSASCPGASSAPSERSSRTAPENEATTVAPWSRRGMPLLGREDPRWFFKSGEVDAMRRLAAAVTQSLVIAAPVEERSRGRYAANTVVPAITLRGTESEQLLVTLRSEGEWLRVLVETSLSNAELVAEVPVAPIGQSFPLFVPLRASDALERATGEIVVFESDVIQLDSDPHLLDASDLQAERAGAIEASITGATSWTRRAWRALLQAEGLDRLVARTIARMIEPDSGEADEHDRHTK